MPLLSLPRELIYEIFAFLTWQDTLSMLCTTRKITEELISRTAIASLRRHASSQLLAWETHERIQRGWPLEENVPRKFWSSHPDHLRYFCINRWECLPCYTCLRRLPFHHITTSMKCGGHSLGQERAHERICIECGIRTGFYKPGARAYWTVVCVKCGSAVHPFWGWKHDSTKNNPFEPFDDRGLRAEADEAERAKYEAARAAHPFGFDTFEFTPRRLWWWDYSSECVDCALEAGYTQEELFSDEARRARVDQYHKQRYVSKMLVRMQRAQDRGRYVRGVLGLPEPAGLPDLEALRLSDDPFPNYRWTPKRWGWNHHSARRAGGRSREAARRSGVIRIGGKIE